MPKPGPKPTSPSVRFWRHVDVSGDCWEWTGSVRGKGYGQFGWRSGQVIEAHRAVWQILVGPIPDGMVIDHMCRNITCVNPDHLRVVTQAENVNSSPVAEAKKTHCRQGHPYAGENLRISSEGKRRCRTCERAVNRRAYYKRKEATDAISV